MVRVIRELAKSLEDYIRYSVTDANGLHKTVEKVLTLTDEIRVFKSCVIDSKYTQEGYFFIYVPKEKWVDKLETKRKSKKASLTQGV